jgi:hypothetical protein
MQWMQTASPILPPTICGQWLPHSLFESTMAKTKTLDTHDIVLIDEAFTVDKARYGTWHSYDSNGVALITSSSEELCIDATRFYLKGLQEGFTESDSSYTGSVDGKL